MVAEFASHTAPQNTTNEPAHQSGKTFRVPDCSDLSATTLDNPRQIGYIDCAFSVFFDRLVHRPKARRARGNCYVTITDELLVQDYDKRPLAAEFRLPENSRSRRRR